MNYDKWVAKLHREREENFDTKLKSLRGCEVGSVYKTSNKKAYIILFSNGMKLTATDIEFGENAFEFI
jgi:hypothetical protein